MIYDFENMTSEELVACYRDENTPERIKDQAMSALVKHNEGLITNCIHKHYANRISRIKFEDLLEAGRIGIFKAACEFDLSGTNKFSTYAFYHIRGEISQWINKEVGQNDKPYYSKLAAKVKKGMQYCEENGLTADANEICEYINRAYPGSRKVSLSSVYHAITAIQSSEVADNYAFHQEEDHSVEDYSAEMALRKDIMTALESLPFEERYVFQLHQGYPYGKVYTNEQIAQKMNKSRMFKNNNYSAFIVNKIYCNAQFLLSHSQALLSYNNQPNEFASIINDGVINLTSSEEALKEFDQMLLNSIDFTDMCAI